MADAIPPTSPTPVVSRPPDALGGSTINVGSNAGDLQTAINASAQGDTLVCPAGVTYNPITLPVRTGSGWTCIRTSTADSSLPAGTRVSTADAAKLFTIAPPGSTEAVSIPQGTQGWRFIGMRAQPADTSFRFGILSCGGDRVSVERSLVLPHASATQTRRAGYVFGSDFQTWDSWWEGRSTVDESQAIHFRSEFQVTSARHHVENCEIRGSTQCVLVSDGADSVPCTDLTFRRSNFFKPTTWQRILGDGTVNPSWDGNNWSVKNTFELKFSRRVLMEGCVLENSWQGAQNGEAFVLNHGFNFSTGKVIDSTDSMFRHNKIINVDRFATINAASAPSPGEATRTAFINNLGLSVRGAFLYLGWVAVDLWLQNNTVVPMGGSVFGTNDGAIYVQTKGPGTSPRWTLKNNVFGWASTGMLLLVENVGNLYPVTTSALDTYFADRSWVGNHQFNKTGTNPAIAGVTFYSTAAVAGVDTVTGQLTTGSQIPAGAGVDFVALTAALTGTVIDGDTTAPTVPSDLGNDTPLSTSYTLTWTASTDAVGVTGYNVEVTDSVTGLVTILSPGNVTSAAVTGLVANRQYGNRVRAFDAAGNVSAYSTNRNVTTAVASTATPAPPSLMRGFGPTRGTGTSDRITLGLTAHNEARTYMFWATRQGVGDATGDTCFFHKATALADAFDESFFQFGANMVYQRKWSTGQGEWIWPGLPADGARHCVIVRYDGASANNHPVVKIDDVPQIVTRTQAPSGSLVTNSNPYVLGNYNQVASSYLNGDLGKFAVFNFISTDANDVSFIEGSDPTGIGAGAVGYWALAGTALEPDTGSGASGNSTLVGTQVQNYTAAPSTTVTVAISSGTPGAGTAWNLTATTTGTVDRVEFWGTRIEPLPAGTTTLLRTDSAAPYTLFASDDLLGAGTWVIEARVFAAAGGSPSDTDTITVIENAAVGTNRWVATFQLCERDPEASGGYKFYVDGVLNTTVPQTAVGTNPVVTAIFAGNDVRPVLSVSAVYGTTEGPKFSISPPRYKATTTSGTKTPSGFQELSRTYIP